MTFTLTRLNVTTSVHMPSKLNIQIGRYSDKGRKDINQDFNSFFIPKEPLLTTKGITAAISDGISSSSVSQEASHLATTRFIDDYYTTTEAWSVKSSASHVLNSINWALDKQTKNSQYRYNRDKGYVCTFSSIIFKNQHAYIFHIGDSRIYRVRNGEIEILTHEHRIRSSTGEDYLQRALGAKETLDIDFTKVQSEPDDAYLLMTDGVYEFIDDDDIFTASKEIGSLNDAAKKLAEKAYANGSYDNLTVQLIQVTSLPEKDGHSLFKSQSQLPFPSNLCSKQEFDGFYIVRNIYSSSRSSVWLAIDSNNKERVAIKTLSSEMQIDSNYVDRFLLEEWIARRINNSHVLKACEQTRNRAYCYVATEYIEGQTLTQWMADNTQPSIQKVRDIAKQIAEGLQALHRQDMIHQDLRPENIMMDEHDVIKIIDFGSVQVAGLSEINSPINQEAILGTMQYTAPEYFLGEYGTHLSDQFSLAVIVYQMLSERLPYGTAVSKSRTKAAQNRLRYRSVLDDHKEIPAWIDYTLQKALNPNPLNRYEAISEFIYDLHNPNKRFINQSKPPLIERNPVLFWKTLSGLLAMIVIALMAALTQQP